MQEKRRNSDRSAETTTALLAAARQLFLEKGYASSSTPEIATAAGVTRGALYHHFRDKLAVFEGVVRQEACAVAQAIADSPDAPGDPLEGLMAGADAYYEAMQKPGRIRLLLLDGPAVLGPQRMRAIDLETGGAELRLGLAEALQLPGTAPELSVLADLVSAMFERAVLAADDGHAALYRAQMALCLRALIASYPELRKASPA